MMPIYSLRTPLPLLSSPLECIAKAELANMSLSYFRCGIADEMRTHAYDEDAVDGPSSFSLVQVPRSGLERFGFLLRLFMDCKTGIEMFVDGPRQQHVNTLHWLSKNLCNEVY